MKKVLGLVVLALLAVAVGTVLAASGTSGRGITPSVGAGNFVASDDQQVCYALAELGINATTDMRGFKIDPPVSYSDGYVNVTLSPDGRSLDWTASNATVHAFIIKGGPNYHVYDYTGETDFNWDEGLHSPMNKKSLPAISHYNVCYTPEPPVGDQGCTPGYWRNHADRWVGAAPSADFDSTFGVDLFSPDVTLGWAIWANGGGNIALARHATAALLNAHAKADGSLDQFVNYPYTVAQVIEMVQDAVANDTIEATKDLFEAANELGCPLSGTPAVPATP
jgi:hypothetical protein